MKKIILAVIMIFVFSPFALSEEYSRKNGQTLEIKTYTMNETTLSDLRKKESEILQQRYFFEAQNESKLLKIREKIQAAIELGISE